MPLITGDNEIVTVGLKISGKNTRKAVSRFSTKIKERERESCTRDIVRNKELASLKLEA
jgi:hypothetical protein